MHYPSKSYLHFSIKSPPARSLALHPSTQSHAILNSPSTFIFNVSFLSSKLTPTPTLTTFFTFVVTFRPLPPDCGQYPSISPELLSNGSFSLWLILRFGLCILSSSPPEPTIFDSPSKKGLLFLCLTTSSPAESLFGLFDGIVNTGLGGLLSLSRLLGIIPFWIGEESRREVGREGFLRGGDGEPLLTMKRFDRGLVGAGGEEV
jgi:hypothetical protein